MKLVSVRQTDRLSQPWFVFSLFYQFPLAIHLTLKIEKFKILNLIKDCRREEDRIISHVGAMRL